MTVDEFDPEILQHLTPEELAELDALLAAVKTIWRPLPGPQSTGCTSVANDIGLGIVSHGLWSG